MAVAVVLDFVGGTLRQYEQVMELMGRNDGVGMPEGGLAHWVQATDDGIRVTDLWPAFADG